ncbi:tetratricopeptide repeat-containing sensor histidine kinase [Polaribacter sp. M15]
MQKLWLFFVLGFFFFHTNGQKKTPDFTAQISNILKEKPVTYKGINNYLKPFRRDTTKLKILAQKFKEANYLDGKTYVENLLGIQYRNYSLFNQAITTHTLALKTAKNAKSIEFEVFSLNMLGVDYRKMDANRTALDYNYEALKLAETVENPSLGLQRSIAVSLNSMGNIYLLLKQYDLAIERFKKSQKLERSIGNELGLAINYQNIGYAKDAQGKTDEALTYFLKSLAINNKINNSFGKVICNGSIANIYIKQNKPKEAISLITTNFDAVKKLGNKEMLSDYYLNLGWAQSKLNQFLKAEKNINLGLTIAKKYNFALEQSYAYSYLSELYQQKKQYKKALEFHKLSYEFENKISNERNTQYVNDLIIKYDSERKNNEIKNLAKQNEIAQLQLVKNRNIWIIIIVTFLLIIAVLYFLYRQRLLQKQKRILTLEQDVLRTQMNPHFIFNALNSIKHYIINNEQKNAVRYLNKFSKLVRKILECSKLKEVSLQEELETMDLYMNIENIRFSNEINYAIEVDKHLDLTHIKVPPLVLQPFLENALWHGLSSKKGNKKIVLSVSQPSKEFILIEIEDNGIGRTASAKIKSKKIINRKSIGIELTKERLQNFIKDFQYPFSLIFSDLLDEEKKPKGTRVALKIPII